MAHREPHATSGEKAAPRCAAHARCRSALTALLGLAASTWAHAAAAPQEPAPEPLGPSTPAAPADTPTKVGSDEGAVCWVAPPKVSKAQAERLERALVLAAEATEPKHVRFKVIRMKPLKKGERADAACKAVIDVSAKSIKARAHEITLSTTKVGEQAPITTTSLVATLSEIADEDLKPAWLKIWSALAPPPPEIPSGPRDVAPSFVDEELTVEQARARPPSEIEKRTPVLSLMATLGFSSRGLHGAPGAAVERANLMSLGVESTLHLSPLVLLDGPHSLDLRAGYARRLASGDRDGIALSIDADRTHATLTYRYELILESHAVSAGPLVGYELLRFEIDSVGDALSVRYGVIRMGVSASDSVLEIEGLRLGALLDLALRAPLAPEGGSAQVGYDVSLGPWLELGEGPTAGLTIRYTKQTGRVARDSFSDGTFDIDLGFGWTL